MKGEGSRATDAGRYEARALEFRGWAGGDPLPLAGVELMGTLREASYETGTGEARLDGGSFDFADIPGDSTVGLDLDEPAKVAEFDFETEPFAPRASAIIFGHPLPVTTDPAAFESLQVVFRARMQEGELALDPLSVGSTTRTSGRVIPGSAVRARASIRSNCIVTCRRSESPGQQDRDKVRGHEEATLEARSPSSRSSTSMRKSGSARRASPAPGCATP